MKAHTPFADSQNFPYTYAEVFDKYTNNPTWYTNSKDGKADTATVKVDGTVKGTGYRLVVSFKVSPIPNDPDRCLIDLQSIDFAGIQSTSENSIAELLYIMFAAYDEGLEDLSEVLGNLDEISGLLTGPDPTGARPSGTEQILGVKGGTNSTYSGVTYGEAFENFFSDPSWKYFVGTQDGPDEDGDGEPDYTVDNVDVVEFTGGCLYADVEVTALIQFVLDHEAGTFQPVYLSFNEVPQNMLMLRGLIDTVFTQAMEDFGLIAPQGSGQGNNQYADYNLHVFADSYTDASESITIDLTVQPNEAEFYCELFWYYGRMLEVGVVPPGVPTQLSEGTIITIDLERNGGIHVVLEEAGPDSFNYEYDLIH